METGGWFVEPTIVSQATPDMAVARDEIFGPVIAVMTFDTEEKAVRLANDTSFGLAATSFSNNINVAVRMARKVQAGTVTVDGYGEGDITTPFSGAKTSALGGDDKGIEAFDQWAPSPDPEQIPLPLLGCGRSKDHSSWILRQVEGTRRD
jgi:gamma-glutamyl-gamma-aminobutyraldehyde dehydrogenase